MNIGYLLNALEARLPELEWRMGALGSALSEHALPKGLFRPCLVPTPAFYINEIKADIQALASQESFRGADFLAKRIHQKINVLIRLCHIQKSDPKIQRPLYAMASMMSTRKQWVESLEKDIANLTAQETAMLSAYEKLQNKGDVQTLVSLQKELGLVKRQLTLAKESLAKI